MTTAELTEAGLLEAILADPFADLPRLVYADWLEEHAQPERAEFIRVQCELARLPVDSTVCSRCYSKRYSKPELKPRKKKSFLALLSECPNCFAEGPFWGSIVDEVNLRRRGRELLKAHWGAWTKGLPLIAIHHDPRNTLAAGHMGVEFRRGWGRGRAAGAGSATSRWAIHCTSAGRRTGLSTALPSAPGWSGRTH